jgi:hypothetical protein
MVAPAPARHEGYSCQAGLLQEDARLALSSAEVLTLTQSHCFPRAVTMPGPSHGADPELDHPRASPRAAAGVCQPAHATVQVDPRSSVPACAPGPVANRGSGPCVGDRDPPWECPANLNRGSTGRRRLPVARGARPMARHPQWPLY